ncbi:MAG: hypothetical protein E8A46_03040 [Bradyrhizobium sp.]|uniref:DUF6538 domain-containing protein n=1 Tax=Bradyrhizobium sp. TaxID=376 RepID=UPI0012047659|nr:DUF6538 domain-containing protein [Bradyrhizobium sp.]THD56684.1 MAG: hypothetical protein E8A46_03040 [Bradyrhizobium sp.]
MPLAMSRPWKHPNSGVFWLRKGVPEDLRKIVGKREEKRSLQTRDQRQNKLTMACGDIPLDLSLSIKKRLVGIKIVLAKAECPSDQAGAQIGQLPSCHFPRVFRICQAIAPRRAVQTSPWPRISKTQFQ